MAAVPVLRASRIFGVAAVCPAANEYLQTEATDEGSSSRRYRHTPAALASSLASALSSQPRARFRMARRRVTLTGFMLLSLLGTTSSSTAASEALELHTAMAELGDALAAHTAAAGQRVSSVFCPADSQSYTDLLSSAQFAWKRKDFRSSRACYGKALQRYWHEYDTSLRPGLIEATRGNVEQLQHDTIRMRNALERLTGQGDGSGDEDGPTAADLASRERQHHLAGHHAAPPGAVDAAVQQHRFAANAHAATAATAERDATRFGDAGSPAGLTQQAAASDGKPAVDAGAIQTSADVSNIRLRELGEKALHLSRRAGARGAGKQAGLKQSALQPQ